MGEIFTKVQESRLKWYGHELRKEEEYVVKRVMEVPLIGWITSETTCWRENCQGGSARPSSMEASHKKHRPHIKVGKDAVEEDLQCISFSESRSRCLCMCCLAMCSRGALHLAKMAAN